uniref:Uncharacterized protein n=1 Tax=Globodera rostochiensis TaxID=31243 RepID=A0A914HMQ1_GLORO
MQKAVKYLSNLYGVDNIVELYSFFKEEISSNPANFFPNPLCTVDCCVHIVNLDHHDQRVYIEGTLDLIGDFELYSTCYPRRLTEGIDWSQPLYVEMKDLMICQKDSPQCRFVQRNQHQVDEMDLFSKTNNIDDDDDDDDNDFSSW